MNIDADTKHTQGPIPAADVPHLTPEDLIELTKPIDIPPLTPEDLIELSKPLDIPPLTPEDLIELSKPLDVPHEFVSLSLDEY